MRCGERGKDVSGLTTLEWLLIVAAVAALAALAVVLVQRTVNNTAEQMERHSPRQEAAETAAAEIQDAARAQKPTDELHAQQINDRWRKRCKQIEILYRDVMHIPNQKRTFVYREGIFKDHATGWDPVDASLPACYFLTEKQ